MKHNTFWGFAFAVPVALAFYLLPMISKDSAYSTAVLKIVLPILSATVSLLFGICYGKDLSVAAAIILMLFPSVFFYYDSSSCIYIIAYGAIATIFALAGAHFHKNKKDR